MLLENKHFFSGFWIYLVFYKLSDSSLLCYMLIYSNGNWNLWLYQIKQPFFFSCTEYNMERIRIITREYQ